MKNYICAALLVLLCLNSYGGADWIPVWKTDRVQLYYDKSSVRRIGTTGRVTGEARYTPPVQFPNTSMPTAKLQVEYVFDCRERTHYESKKGYASANGTTLRREEFPEDFVDVLPESDEELMLIRACGLAH
jgi:hypothetical protein